MSTTDSPVTPKNQFFDEKNENKRKPFVAEPYLDEQLMIFFRLSLLLRR
jgi:hypothetical protein